jgi:hypothetical protein
MLATSCHFQHTVMGQISNPGLEDKYTHGHGHGKFVGMICVSKRAIPKRGCIAFESMHVKSGLGCDEASHWP